VRPRKRVRLHLADPHPDTNLPSVEGILLSRRFGEYVIAQPSLLIAANAQPAELSDARELRVPVGRVAFYEVLR
jgi:hypothetical protein